MAGILVQLAISWLIVWFFDKQTLSVLGLMPTRRRMLDFTLFFFISVILSASGYFLKMLIAHQLWQLNPQINLLLIAEGIWYTIKSVLYEELIFRGALFYILIKKLGAAKAILVSASAFGIYHWFTHNALGNPQAMIMEFVVTGAMGLVLAYGYAKTGSLYIPIAIHFGWNVVQQVGFSNGPIGNQILIEVMPRPIVTISYASYFFMQLFPLVSVLVVNYWVIRERKPDIKSKL